MSLYGALQIGVAGLGANSQALSTTASNIANVNTVGYKASESAFSTLLASSDGTQAGVIANQAQRVTTQGGINGTQSPTDLAISGNGFFVVSPTTVALRNRCSSLAPATSRRTRRAICAMRRTCICSAGRSTPTAPCPTTAAT
jgi:flagellar hook protein FlgE